MSAKNAGPPPASLAGHFDPPPDHAGHFGWLCGYSAGESFLNDALTRFTGLTTANRAALGQFFLAAVLDRGNPPLLPTAVPGLAHLPLTEHKAGPLPFRLLHAKVALLGYRHLSEPGRWRLRLLVSTGNWTRQSLEESLDLIWRLDIAGGPRGEEGLNGRDCADVSAAWDFLRWLGGHADTGLLSAGDPVRPGASRLAREEVSGWVSCCARKASGELRFFDSRKAPLLDQLLERLARHREAPRTSLAMGSGFYEGEGATGTPLVPQAILRRLREAGHLTRGATVDIFVNPGACQALASPGARAALQERGILLRPPGRPEAVFGKQAGERTLHAKFIFSATERNGAYKNPWLYLGSGNLTRPGFLSAMSPSGGNLEAGVLLFPREELRKAAPADSGEPGRAITRLLPVQWDETCGEADALGAGEPPAKREAFMAPPVTWLLWDDTDAPPVLRAVAPTAPFWVLDPAATRCHGEADDFHWEGPRPALVNIGWGAAGNRQQAQVPVVDRWGRAAARDLPALETDEAWEQLASFPLPPEEDEDEDTPDGDAPGGGDGADGHGAPAVNGPAHPIRRMMELIENIAGRQASLREPDWPLWCLRLEQALGQARDSRAVACFRDELGLNPLWPLLAPCFRPEFAEDGASEEGRRYEEALGRVRAAWAVDGLPGLGEAGAGAPAPGAREEQEG